MSTVTGIQELETAELEIKKGVIFNTSGCCASGTRTDDFLPKETTFIHEELDSLDIDGLIAELLA